MGRIKPVAAGELRQWMERTQRSHPDVADAFGVTQAHIRHLLTGGRTPSLALALRIHTLTGIPVAAWAKPSASEAVA